MSSLHFCRRVACATTRCFFAQARETLAALKLREHSVRLETAVTEQNQAMKPKVCHFAHESIIVFSGEQSFDRFLADLAQDRFFTFVEETRDVRARGVGALSRFQRCGNAFQHVHLR
jgi:hypothetical protein